MSRRLLIGAAAIGCALALAGCQAVVSDVAKLDPAAPAIVSKVRTYVVEKCSYEPEAAFVERVVGTLTGFSAFVDPVVAAGDAICRAATTGAAVTASLDGRPVAVYAQSSSGGSVNGEKVEGRFVRKKGG